MIPTMLAAKIDEANGLIDEAVDRHARGKRVTAVCLLFSGGGDSTVLAHLLRHRATTAVHVNTGIGVEQTRQFVRDTCAAWGLPLIEECPPPGSTYRELVIANGFPGPAHHWKMYQRLKERALRAVRRRLVKNPRQERIVFLAGRRREESARRMNVPDMEREGSVVWVSPIVNWTDDDMTAYHLANPDLPINEVSQLIHMSGECLCGAFAKKDEMKEVRFWFPKVGEEIDRLEADVRAAGHPAQRCVWGWGADRTTKRSKSGPLCSSCSTRGEQS